MLHQVYTVQDIMNRYKIKTRDTAIKYMKEMGAVGKPYFVTERQIENWERTKIKKT